MTLNEYLILSTILFSIGLIGVIRRKNLLMLFFSTEIMLNAVNVGLAAISKFHDDLTGQLFAFFIVAIAAVGPIRSVQQVLLMNVFWAACMTSALPMTAAMG